MKHTERALSVWLVGMITTVCLVRPQTAQADPITDFQMWSQVQATVELNRITEGLSATMEGTVRRGSPAQIDSAGQQVEQPVSYLFFRPSVSYALTSWFVATLGYAYTPVYCDAVSQRPSCNIQEQRVWQQATFKTALRQLDLSSRTRLEERWRTLGAGAGETELRLRQRMRGAYRFRADLPWQAIVTDEVFIFLNETDFKSSPGFSENRVFVGLGYQKGQVTVELGYLNQFVGGSASHKRENHVFSSSLSFVFGDFAKSHMTQAPPATPALGAFAKKGSRER